MTIVLLLSVLSLATDTPRVPVVAIHKPPGGWSTNRIVEVKGEVSDQSVNRATMVVNGYERWIDVRAGKFSATIVVSKGSNSLEVVAANQAGVGRDSVSFFSDVPPVDMQVILAWDTNGTDVDLHVTDPSGEECYYGHRVTKAGGKLDVDDTDGYGPEVFTLANALSGKYKITVKYFSSHGHAQTECQAQVVLFEGTNRERRVDFSKMLTKTGDVEEVGTFQIEGAQDDDDQP
jgi:uncharacterized protein YfaP (DUF2135 family)